MTNLRYPSGFGNEFATEALPGALPVGRNSPQCYVRLQSFDTRMPTCRSSTS